MTFTYHVKTLSRIKKGPVFAHLSIDDYQPTQMVVLKENREFAATRMVPPNSPIRYFFSNPAEVEVDFERSANYVRHDRSEARVEFLFKNESVQLRHPDHINEAQSGPPQPVLSEVEYEPVVQVAPRETMDLVSTKKKSQWSVEKSIFRDWKPDSEETFAKCFEFDWKCSRIPRLIKNQDDLASLHQLLKENYASIMSQYKYYSALSPAADVYSISSNSFNEFLMQSTKILDGQRLKLRDLDLQFVATNTSQGTRKADGK